MLRNKLVITLTTAQGSRQYTLGQITKYLLAVFLVISVCSFFVSNLLLVKTTDHLLNLEEGFDTLSLQYEDTLGASEQQKGQLDQLSRSLSQLQVEKNSSKKKTCGLANSTQCLMPACTGWKVCWGYRLLMK
ncbi:hypothetical protein [Aliamphritea spongicola]|nr:hypothetical protein [Aliamphritea spongicola]